MNIYLKSDLVKLLSFFYGTMLASSPLLSMAMDFSDGELKAYYEEHLAEEDGHDLILLDDLHRLGVTEPERFHYAAQFAGSQYYLIAHEHPALLLGYMRALESSGLSPDDVDRLSAHHGVELKCLKHHALHDPDHKKGLDQMISAVDSEIHPRILWNEENTRHMLMNARL